MAQMHIMEMDSTALFLLSKYITTQPHMVIRGMPKKLEKFLELQAEYEDRLMTKDEKLIKSVLKIWSVMDIDKYKKDLYNTLEYFMESDTFNEGMKIRGAGEYKRQYNDFIMLHDLLTAGTIHHIEFENTVNFLVYILVEN
jgi:hypothetical protein